MLEKIKGLFGRRPPTGGEDDVAADGSLARSRAIGGRDTDDGDSATTTGTGDSESFVGRVGGQDVGYSGTTGAEARAPESDDRPRDDRGPD